MFAPLSFLGTIYSSVIQSLVDVKHLLNLLTEEPEVLDVEDAPDIPTYTASTAGRAAKVMRTGGNSDGAYATFPCAQCGKTVQDSWLCCPFCRADISRPTAGGFANLSKLSIALGDSSKTSTQTQVSRGVSVEFESTYLLQL